MYLYKLVNELKESEKTNKLKPLSALRKAVLEGKEADRKMYSLRNIFFHFSIWKGSLLFPVMFSSKREFYLKGKVFVWKACSINQLNVWCFKTVKVSYEGNELYSTHLALERFKEKLFERPSICR